MTGYVTVCIPYSNGSDDQGFIIEPYIPLLFSSNGLPIMFPITFPQGDNSCKTAMASKQPPYCVHSPQPTLHGLTPVTPPLEKSTKRPLCESTET